jgi:lincosamide nucleotidyltransferase A/C/D/E
MTEEEVLTIYKSLEDQNILVWIDGGWAVDALLGQQTRPHQDLDLAVQRKDLEILKAFLASNGFTQVERDEELMWDAVLVNDKGSEIEIHSFSFDDNTKVVEEKYWNGYSAESLTGVGKIMNTEVKCVSLEQLVKTHDGNRRVLKNTDLQDMELLRERFKVEFP